MPSLSKQLTLLDIIARISEGIPEDSFTFVGSLPNGNFKILTYHPDDLPEDDAELRVVAEEFKDALLTKQWGDYFYKGMEELTALTPVGAPQFDCAAHDDFKWDVIKARLEAQEPEEDDQNDDHLLKSLYLGSILHIAPSGQCRAPWSSVAPCPFCGGSGNFPNVLHDPQSFGLAEKLRAKITVRNRDAGLHFDQWTQIDRNAAKCLDAELQCTRSSYTCAFCSGHGSRVAIEDQEFMEYLEKKAEEIGGFITGSDGDGCDVVIQKVVEKPEEPEVVHDSDAESEHLK